MADPLISDRQAELAWRLGRTIADPAEKSVNDTHVAELTRLIADALSPPQPKEPPHAGMDTSVALVVILTVFALFGLFISL